ncbi:hypothetical protein [Aeromicrobium sp. 179-A 4D2 NHS]|uniref:hypothetical protein n=1 Tax=Aeromicrobium sp. 179-A 4D2 NHS TaxID=3142375 RepID=UPI0039A3312E
MSDEQTEQAEPTDSTREWLAAMGNAYATSVVLAAQVADLHRIIEMAKNPAFTIVFQPAPAHVHDPTAPGQTTPM